MDNESESEKIIDKVSALFDLEQLMLILRTSCISFFQLDKNKKSKAFKEYEKIKKFLDTVDFISVNSMFDLILRIVKDIKDFHSCIYLNSDERKFYAFGKKHIPFYNEKVYEFINGTFINIENKNEIIKDIEIINTVNNIKYNKNYFVPIIYNSSKKYRLVVFSEQKTINYNNYYPVNYDWSYLSRYRNEFNNRKCSYWVFLDDTWQEKEKEIRYNEIYQEIKSARKKKIVIIDNRANFGGIPNKQMNIIFFSFRNRKLYKYLSK